MHTYYYIEIIWWHAWPLSTFSVNLPILKCMTDIAFSPSIRSKSILFQVCWLIRSCMIRMASQPLFSIRVRIQSVFLFPSLPCVPNLNMGTTSGWWELVSPGVGVRRLLISLLRSAKLVMTSQRICGTSFISLSSSLSSTTSSATFSSSEAGIVLPTITGPGSSSSVWLVQLGSLCMLYDRFMLYKPQKDSGRQTSIVTCLLF